MKSLRNIFSITFIATCATHCFDTNVHAMPAKIYNCCQEIKERQEYYMPHYEGGLVVLSGDGQTLVAGRYNELLIKVCKRKNDGTFDLVAVQTLESRALAINQDGTILASGSSEGEIKICKMEKDGTYTPFMVVAQNDQTRAHARSVTALAFSKNGQILVSGSSEESIKIWKLKNGKYTHCQTIKVGPYREQMRNSLVLSDDNQTLIFGSNCAIYSAIYIYKLHDDGNDGKYVPLQEIGCYGGYPVLSKDQRTLAFVGGSFLGGTCSHRFGGCFGGGLDINIFLLKNDGTYVYHQTIEGAHAYPLYALAFSSDDNTLASGASDDRIRIWRRAKGDIFAHDQTIKHFGDCPTSLVFNKLGDKDNETLVSSGMAGVIRVFQESSFSGSSISSSELNRMITSLVKSFI